MSKVNIVAACYIEHRVAACYTEHRVAIWNKNYNSRWLIARYVLLTSNLPARACMGCPFLNHCTVYWAQVTTRHVISTESSSRINTVVAPDGSTG